MAPDWRETTLGEVALFDSGRRNSQDAVEAGAYPFFTCSKEILRHSEFDFDCEAVIMAGNNAEARFHLQYFKGKFAARQRTYVITPRSSDLDCRYLYYALHLLQPLFTAQAQGTTTKFVTIGILREAPITLPPIAEQRGIAQILGALDDKIALNRWMSETLDGVARASFKSWFVDFDPVRAKAAGRDTGLPKSLADLFPSGLIGSELGDIPDGWDVASIGDACEVIDCLHTRKPMRQESGPFLLQLWNVRDDGLLDMADPYCIAQDDYDQWVSRMEASPGDCVITNVGRVGVGAQVPAGLKAALGRNMTGLRCRTEFSYPTVLILCLLSDPMRNEIGLRTDSGTILDSLNVRSIPKLRFVRPDDRVLNVFEGHLRPLRRKMEQILAECRTLAALRDGLLPKLISGEVRVPRHRKLSGAQKGK